MVLLLFLLLLLFLFLSVNQHLNHYIPREIVRIEWKQTEVSFINFTVAVAFHIPESVSNLTIGI